MSFTPFADTDKGQGTGVATASNLVVTLPLQALEDLPLAIAIVEGKRHRFVFANAAYRSLALPNKADVLGRTLSDVFPGATSRNTAFIDKVYATGRPVRLRRQIIRAIPGRTNSIWNVDLIPLRGESGEVASVLLVLDDVSDIVNSGVAMAQEAAEANVWARRILESVTRHISRDGAAGGTTDILISPSRRAAAMPEGAQEEPPDEKVQLWYLRRRDGGIASANELPLTPAMAADDFLPTEELILERSDGERFHILCNAGPMVRDAGGDVSGGIVVCRDVSALRRLEDKLRAAEDSLQLALESANMASWDLDLTTGTTRRSLHHDELFGYREPLSEWRRGTFLAHVVPEDRGAVAAAFDAARNNGSIEFECRVRRVGDGETRWLAVRGRTYCDDAGAPVRIAGIVQDITERKQAEFSRRQEREKIEHLKKLARDEILARYERMTPRQKDVLCLVVAGLSNKEIGHRLGISERTVEVHRGWVMEKMKARSVADLVRLAAAIGVEPAGPPPGECDSTQSDG